MAWFDRSTGGKNSPDEERPIEEPIPPINVEVAPPKPADEELVACLFKGSRVTGQLTFHGPAKIDGNVEGEIQCHGVLTIGQEAEVRAKVSGKVVVVQGRVEGDVTAKERVELRAPARLIGNLNTPRLIITEGVVFDGDCSMGGAEQKSGVQSSPALSAEKSFEGKPSKLATDSE